MAALAFCCHFRFHGPGGEVSGDVGTGEVVVRERTEGGRGGRSR